MPLTVLDHPLAKHYLTVLRDKRTLREEFRSAARRLCYFLTLEATRDLPVVRERTVETPLEQTTGYETSKVVAIAVLRRPWVARRGDRSDPLGQGRLCRRAAQRTDRRADRVLLQTARPREGDGARAGADARHGRLLSWAIGKAKASGASRIALCVVAAPDGVAHIEREHPDVRIVVAALDRDLNDHFYIRPGLGDMGDRLFGTP